MNSQRVLVAGAVVAAVLITSVVAGALGGPNPATCVGDATAGHVAPLDQLKATGEIVTPSTSSAEEPSFREWTLSRPLAPGSYVLSGVSWDGYSDRKSGEVQPFEIWFVEVLTSTGERLTRSNRTTGDIPDGVDEATWAGGLGNVTWTAGQAAKVRVVHPEASPTQNSVVPICVALSLISSQTVTTAPPTTVASEPSATAPASTAPTTATPTTVPVEVKGITITQTPPAQIPDPNPVQPRFTG